MKRNELDSAIIADLADKTLTYAEVMVRHRVGITRVITLSKQHGLTRPRGRKPPARVVDQVVK
jgi:hypothetical protein